LIVDINPRFADLAWYLAAGAGLLLVFVIAVWSVCALAASGATLLRMG